MWNLLLVWSIGAILVLVCIFMKYLFTHVYDNETCEDFFLCTTLISCFWFIAFPWYFAIRVIQWIRKKRKVNERN